MNGLKFTFHFLPIEDRVALVFEDETREMPTIVLTRRIVKMMCAHLRRILEGAMSSDGHMYQDQKTQVMAFAHEAFIHEKTGNDEITSEKKQLKLKNPSLTTRINFQKINKVWAISFFRQKTLLVRMRMGKETLHQVYHALAAISATAEWDLQDIFGWAKTEGDGQGMGKGYIC